MAIEITRQELTVAESRAAELRATELQAAAAKTTESRAARRMPRDRAGAERGRIGRVLRRPAGWSGRPCGEADQETFRGTVSPPTGCIATPPRGWQGSRTADRPKRRRC